MAQVATEEDSPPDTPPPLQGSALKSGDHTPVLETETMMSVCTSIGGEEDPLLMTGEEWNEEAEEGDESSSSSPSCWQSSSSKASQADIVPKHQITSTTADVSDETEVALLTSFPNTKSGGNEANVVSPSKATATWVRVAATAYFVSITISLAIVSTTCLVGVISAYKTLELVGTLVKESEESKTNRLCRRENAVGLLIDLFVRSIMKASSWIFDVKVLGEGSPVDKMSKEELVTWIQKNKETRNGIDYCKLPRRPTDNRLRLPGACMVMCNHMSNIDGFTLKSALFPSVSKAIIKSEVKYVPFIGWTVALSGQPLVHFTREKGGWGTVRKEELVERCKQVIERNFPLLVYPEGVRQRFGRMAPFRYGMFNLAIQNGYPILPSVIHGSQKAWPVSSPLVDFATIYLKFSDELILPKQGDSPDAVIDAVRSKMLELLEGIPGYNAMLEAPIISYQEYKQLEKAERESRKKR